MNRLRSGFALVVMIFVLIGSSRSIAQDDWTPESLEFFERNVRPLLLENCMSCHSKAVNKVKGGLNMDSRHSLLAGGDSGSAIDLDAPEKSLLMEAVRRESFEMPPERPLSAQQIAVLEKWIKMGAPWPDNPKSAVQGEGWRATRAAEHWAWQPLKRPNVPSTIDSWPLTTVDAFVHQQLQSQGIQPSPPAKRHELLRRLFVDLTGLPPTPEQLRDLAPDQELGAVIDRLLASEQFGVHWGRHWLDLMRYSETLGHEFDYPIHNAWRYRDAVVNAFNEDLPYDKMLAEHIAGDMVQTPRIHPTTGVNESLASTGWWWLGDSVHAPVDAKADWATRTENQVDVFSKAFLGMTVACARCHDHKFDAIGADDYYGLVGVARSIRRSYAITDPHRRVELHREKIRATIDGAGSFPQECWGGVTNDSVRSWLEHYVSEWRKLSAEDLRKTLPVGSTMYPLRLLVEQPEPGQSPEEHFEKKLAELRAEASNSKQAYEKWQADSVPIGDFRGGLPSGWKLEAVKSDDWANPPSIDWFETGADIANSTAVPRLESTFNSRLFGPRQQVTLRSPNFKLSHRCVCLKMRSKGTQSIVCVNGFFMNEFSALLFADARKQAEQLDDRGWVVHAGDLNKYAGDPTFIALETQGDAWFEIAEARLADRGPPPQPHPVAVEMLQWNSASQDAFKELVIARLKQSLTACSKSNHHSAPTQVDGVSSDAGSSDAQSNNRSLARAILRLSPNLVLGQENFQQILLTRNKLTELDASSPVPTRLIAATEGHPTDAAIELRGNPHTIGETTPRGCFQSLVPWTAVEPSSSGRKELIQSLTDPRHPLVARVIVNRVWFYLMGRGLSNSPDNLGVLGSRPTHPELLDHLAGQFMEQGWSIKWLIREIMLSQTYQLSSTPLPQHLQSDADASLYSHRVVRRLTAEVLRDAIVLTSNSLDNRMSEPSVPIYLTEQMTGRGRPGSSGPLDGQNRRSLFIEVRRNFLDPFLLAFDFPMPSTTTGKRNVSNVPAQALGLLNDPLVAEMCRRWVDSTAGYSDPRQRVSQMILAAFSRPPSDAEIDNCLKFVNQSSETGWIDLAHTLLNAKEFWYLK
jgi:cytochrome c553